MATATIGATGRQYANVPDYITSLGGSLSADEVGEFYNDALFTLTNSIQITGITMNGYTLTLRCAAGQGFKDNQLINPSFKLQYDQAQGVAFFCSDGLYNPMWICTQSGLIVDGIQAKATASSTNALTVTGGSVVKNSIFDSAYNGSTIQLDSSSASKIINVLNIHRHASFTQGSVHLQSSAQAINCGSVKPSGVAASGKGFTVAYGGLVKNCFSFGFSAGYSASGWDGGSNHNASDDATAPGANSQQSKTYANQFNSTTDDWSPKAGADLIDLGNTDATNAPTDILGKTRGLTTLGDIGPREYFFILTVSPDPGFMVMSSANPIVRQSSMAVTPAPSEMVMGRAGPAVLPDGFTPTPGNMVMSSVAPTVALAGITLSALTPGFMVLSGVDPLVQTVGGTLIQPLPGMMVMSSVNPTVLGGNLVVAPAAGFMVLSSVGPLVQLGSLNIIPTINVPNMIMSSVAGFFLGGYVNMAWEASLQGTPLGYKLHYGSATGNYTGTGAIRGDNGQKADSPIDVGLQLSMILRNLPAQQNWFFAVTAYNALGESGYSNELVVFVTTGLFIAPALGGMVMSGVDPTVIGGGLSLTPAAGNMVLASAGPTVGSAGNVSIVPDPGNMVLASLPPGVIQTSMVIFQNLISGMVMGGVDPTVGITGQLNVAPVPGNLVMNGVDPAVRLGSFTIPLDAINQTANMRMTGVDPETTIGFIVVTPAAGNLVLSSVDPTLAFGNLIFPAPGELFFSSVAPTVQYGSVTVSAMTPGNVVLSSKGPSRVGVSVGALANPSLAGDDVVVMYPRRRR